MVGRMASRPYNNTNVKPIEAVRREDGEKKQGSGQQQKERDEEQNNWGYDGPYTENQENRPVVDASLLTPSAFQLKITKIDPDTGEDIT